MDCDDRRNGGLAPTREVTELVRRLLAWLAEEFESTEEEVVRLMAEAAREIRDAAPDDAAPARSLAGILQNAAALFQLLRELRPGGLPLDELEATATRLKIRDLIEKAEGRVPADDEMVLKLLKIHHVLEKEDIEPDEFMEVASRAGKLLDLKATIEDLGGTEDRVRELLSLGQYLEDRGLKVEGVKWFVDFHLKLHNLGFDYKSARALASALSKVRKQGGADARAVDRLLDLAREDVEIQKDISRLQTTRADLRRQIASLSAERSRLQNQVQPLRRSVSSGMAALDHVRRQYRSAAAQVNRLLVQAREEENRLALIREQAAKEQEKTDAQAARLTAQIGQIRNEMDIQSRKLVALIGTSLVLPAIKDLLVGEKVPDEFLSEMSDYIWYLRFRRTSGSDENLLVRLTRVVEVIQKHGLGLGGKKEEMQVEEART